MRYSVLRRGLFCVLAIEGHVNPFDFIPNGRIIFKCLLFGVYKTVSVYNFPDVGTGDGEVIAVHARRVRLIAEHAMIIPRKQRLESSCMPSSD